MADESVEEYDRQKAAQKSADRWADEVPLPKPQYPDLMSQRVLELAARGLSNPKQLPLGEIEELCGSVLEHIAAAGSRE